MTTIQSKWLIIYNTLRLTMLKFIYKNKISVSGRQLISPHTKLQCKNGGRIKICGRLQTEDGVFISSKNSGGGMP